MVVDNSLIKFDFSGSDLSKNLDKLAPKMLAAVLMYANTKSVQYTSYMQTHRPWTDRTGMAKATLNTQVSQPNDHTVRLTLSHGVEYGIWLELAHGKNYAIVAPTVRLKGPEIVSELSGLMDKVVL